MYTKATCLLIVIQKEVSLLYYSTDQPRGDYWVLSTDYTDYSVVWSCSKLGGLSFANLRKYTTQLFKQRLLC